MTDYRRARRRKASEPIDIVDTMTEVVVGQLSNLSETGMLLMLNQRLNSDALYQFAVRLPQPTGEHATVQLGSHELWSDDAAAPGQVWSGFRFIDVSPADALQIRNWVELPGGQYV